MILGRHLVQCGPVVQGREPRLLGAFLWTEAPPSSVVLCSLQQGGQEMRQGDWKISCQPQLCILLKDLGNLTEFPASCEWKWLSHKNFQDFPIRIKYTVSIESEVKALIVEISFRDSYSDRTSFSPQSCTKAVGFLGIVLEASGSCLGKMDCPRW